jgi:hypothetical protein
VVYLLDVDATGTVAPTLTSVSAFGSPAGSNGGSGTPSNADCGRPLSSLTTSQLALCLQQFANQLASREGQGTSTPTASAKPAG